ncbi:MAG: hydrogenase [Methanoregulaceae archaeon]|nr:hydrogenase [Methanoregulaceae archaeon]
MIGLDVFSSGFGVWDPLVWLLAIIIALIIAYVIWSRGNSSYKKGSEQGRPYLSGNPEPAKGEVHVRAGNLYWGFIEGIRGYYDRVIPVHSGNLNEYILWYLAVMVIVMIAVVVFP